MRDADRTGSLSQNVNDEDEVAITRAIIPMARVLNIDVIAEGIETEEQMEYLRNLDCQYGQGFLLSLPVTSERYTALLDESLENGWIK